MFKLQVCWSLARMTNVQVSSMLESVSNDKCLSFKYTGACEQ